MRRIQENFLALPERRLLNALCALMPRWITPDLLTALGFAGAVAVFAGFSLGRPGFLWLAVAGLAVNWAGDSLDGSLARHRNIQKPRYGYFLDHSVDALNNLLIMLGLGLSGHVRPSIALMALCGYYMLGIHAFLKRQVLNELPLSFWYLGPTELRIILAGMAAAMFFLPDREFFLAGYFLNVYEILLLIAAASFVLIFTLSLLATARRLRRDGD